MYRLVEEQNNSKYQQSARLSASSSSILEDRLHNSEKFFASRVVSSSTEDPDDESTPVAFGASCVAAARRASTGGVHSPPRLLPYDELQMDERQRQEQRQRIRSKLRLSQGPPSPNPRRRTSTSTPDEQPLAPGTVGMDDSLDFDASFNTQVTSNTAGSRRRTIAHLEMPGAAAQQPQQQPAVAPATTGGLPPHPPPMDRRRRKSKPWQTDVILNRFSGGGAGGASTNGATASTSSSSSLGTTTPAGRNMTGSSSTQKSTWGWKQRMQERKAVFGNVAVPEQSFDEEDGPLQEEEDDDEVDDLSSRGGKANAESIREEAVELLRSKGFHNFQGILQQQYDDDLESVGGSVRTASSPTFLSPLASPTPTAVSTSLKQHKLRLEEIKTLRAKILRHQEMERMDSTDSIPDVTTTTTVDAKEEKEQPDDEKEGAFSSDQEKEQQKQLRESQSSTLTVTTATTQTTNATSSSSTLASSSEIDSGGSSSKPSSSRSIMDENSDAVKAWKVMKQLKVRLLDVFTADHYIVEAMGRKGLDSPTQTKIVFDETAFDRHRLRDAVEKRVSLVFTGHHHIVCNGQVEKRDVDGEDDVDGDEQSVDQESLQKSLAAARSHDDSDTALQGDEEDDDYDESQEEKKQERLPSIRSPELRERLSGSFLAFEALLQARKQAAMAADDDWTECSTSVVETPSARNAPGMLPSLPTENRSADADDQSCWTEYTLDDDRPEQDNRRLSVDTAHSQTTVAAAREVGGLQTEQPRTVKRSNTQKAITISQSNSDEWEEYTCVDDTVQEEPLVAAVAPFRLPGQAQMPVQTRRQQDHDDQSYMELTVRDDQMFSPQRSSDEDDQSFMEMTVHDTPPTRLPTRRVDDDKSYMEVTVQDGHPSFRDMVSPDLTSPHLSNMLSSRMFADMELPSELRQQQPQHRSLVEDENHESYPTITIGHDDDDMTQITFDHTMMEVGSASHDHHRHAMQYLDNSAKTKESYRSSTTLGDAPDLPSIVGSQHTEQTRDTTVSDDGSSNQDGASFKSCVSSESSQFVAELLRRDIWSPDSTVVRLALEKLEQEASKGVHERSNIVKYGGLLAILRSMDMKPDQAPIQMAACAALEKMAIDAATQVAIGEVGGIPAIAHAMEGHIDNVLLQQTACRALAVLTRHRDDNVGPSCKDPPQAEGVVAVVTKTMTKHPEDPEIQAHSFGALANLCLDNQDRLRELKQSGGLGTMTMALQVPWANKTDQHEAISTLSILLRSLTDLDQR